MLASHNSWSYLPVRQWLLKPFSWIAKCQNISVRDQFRLGVRYFDLRVCYDKKLKKMVLCHGLAKYDRDFTNDLHWLVAQWYVEGMKAPELYCRVLLEDRGRGHSEEGDEAFFNLCSQLEIEFPKIHFVAGYPLGERWRKYIYNFKTEEITLAEVYGSVHPKWKYLPIPKIFAKKFNKESYKSDMINYIDQAIMIDFVNIK